jgi:DNA polymerase-4
LCRGVIVVPPDMSAYAEASRAVMAIFADVTPLVEPL